MTPPTQIAAVFSTHWTPHSARNPRPENHFVLPHTARHTTIVLDTDAYTTSPNALAWTRSTSEHQYLLTLSYMQPDIIANKQNSNKDNLFFILSCIFPFSSKFYKHGNKTNFRQKKRSEKSPLIFEEILHSIQNNKINDLYIILDFSSNWL